MTKMKETEHLSRNVFKMTQRCTSSVLRHRSFPSLKMAGMMSHRWRLSLSCHSPPLPLAFLFCAPKTEWDGMHTRQSSRSYFSVRGSFCDKRALSQSSTGSIRLCCGFLQCVSEWTTHGMQHFRSTGFHLAISCSIYIYTHKYIYIQFLF